MNIYLGSFVVLAAVLVAQIFSLEGYFHGFPIANMFMHLAGGLGIGLLVSGLIQNYRISPWKRGTIVIIVTLAFGFLWEVIEVYYNISGAKPWSDAYYVDTAKDLANDLVGSLAAVWATSKINKIFEK